jgi:hypothetical protein
MELERVAAKVDTGFASQPAKNKDLEPANRFIRFATGSKDGDGAYRRAQSGAERGVRPSAPLRRRRESNGSRRNLLKSLIQNRDSVSRKESTSNQSGPTAPAAGLIDRSRATIPLWRED